MKNKRNSGIFILLLGMLFLANCINQYPATPEGTYAQSLTMFNDSVEAYYNTLVLQTPEVKTKWKQDINPLIYTAGAALDAWGNAIGTGTEISSQQIYAQLWRELWRMLIRFEILKVEE